MLFELFNRFWRDVEMSDYKSQEANLYFYLVHYCNKNGWVNPFSIPNKRIVLSTGLSEKTVIDCRCRLQQRGLIDFRGGKRKAASPMYCFPVSGDNGFYFPWESKTESKNDSKTGSKNGSKTGSYINKTINSKTENDTPNPLRGSGVRAREPSVPESLFSEKELKSARPKGVKASQMSGFLPPTLELARSHFLSQRADLRLTDWEIEVNSFFNYYDSQGWVKSNGRKVANWESLANDWILRKEKEIKQLNQNEQNKGFKRSSPEDVLAAEQSKLAGRILQRRNNTSNSGGADGGNGIPF